MLDDLSSFQRVLFTNHRVRGLAEAVRAGTTPAGSRPATDTGLKQRARRCPRAPARSATAGLGSRHRRPRHTPRPRRSLIPCVIGQCPRPIDPGAIRVRTLPPSLARNARRMRSCCRSRRPSRLEYSPPAPRFAASSDPGRALLLARPRSAAVRRLGEARSPGSRDVVEDGNVLHTNRAATLEEMVDHYIHFSTRAANARRLPVHPLATTDGAADRRPTPKDGGARG